MGGWAPRDRPEPRKGKRQVRGSWRKPGQTPGPQRLAHASLLCLLSVPVVPVFTAGPGAPLGGAGVRVRAAWVPDTPGPLQGCTVRSTWTTATPPSTPSPEAPSASTTAPVWTRWAATAAPACPALWASAARAMSTNACPTPVTPAAPRTACSASTTSTASVGLATPVGAAGLGGWGGAGGSPGPGPASLMPALVPRAPLRVGHQRLQRQALQERRHLRRGCQHRPRVHLQVPDGRCRWGSGLGGLPGQRAAAGPQQHSRPRPAHTHRPAPSPHPRGLSLCPQRSFLEPF